MKHRPERPEGQITTKYIEEFTGMPQRTIQAYTDRDILRPSVQDSNQTGVFRYYNQADLVKFCAVKIMQDAGMKPKLINSILKLAAEQSDK